MKWTDACPPFDPVAVIREEAKRLANYGPNPTSFAISREALEWARYLDRWNAKRNRRAARMARKRRRGWA